MKKLYVVPSVYLLHVTGSVPVSSPLPSVSFVQWPAETEPCPYRWVFVRVRFPSFLSICPVLSFAVLLNLKCFNQHDEWEVCLLVELLSIFMTPFFLITLQVR